ncbi:hypothetical protein SDC9_99181 [bioreactor metagenome]|uniref:Uncharacterized protein n=1 Tax=bioreactor metagenome TaxID=1076179 RepID=A0A645AGT6_9ZZZZ|nr:hypothetical protein [Candidatus Metalachnospira sp.]
MMNRFSDMNDMNDMIELMDKIKVPGALKDKVLDASDTVHTAKPKNSRHQSKRHTAFRVAVCAVFALAFLLGGLSIFQSGANSPSTTTKSNGTTTLSPSYHFGLEAYAADNNETYAPKDNKIAFSIGSSGGGEITGKGDYTGCLFRVTGDGIKTISASIDRGGFYRYKKLDNLTKDEIEAIFDSEKNGTLNADCQFASSDDLKTWCSEQMTALGSSFSEDWTADGGYGFWVPPESIQNNENEDLRAAAHREIDTFNGAVLTITATFEDGSQQTKTLNLKTGKLKVVLNEDHNQTVLPELADDNEPYIYSVYAELEN